MHWSIIVALLASQASAHTAAYVKGMYCEVLRPILETLSNI